MNRWNWSRHSIVAVGLMLAMSGCNRGAPDNGAASAGAEAATESSVDLIGTKWEWVRTVTPVERVEAADPTRYSITLDGDGGVAAQFDCNSGRGSFEIAENRITFGVFAATRMACPEDTQDFEFMSQLEKAASFFIEDGELFLEMPYDSGTMRFRPASDRN